MTQCEVINFYLYKIENYLSRKHSNILQKSSMSSCGDSIYSGSPKSTLSDRNNTLEDEDKEEGFEKKAKSTSVTSC